MRRRLLAVLIALGAPVLLSCSNVVGPGYREFDVQILQVNEYFDRVAGEYVEELVLGVSDNFGRAVPGAAMHYGITAGILDFAEPFSDRYGTAGVVWSLIPPERFSRPTISICASNSDGIRCLRTTTLTLR